MTFRILFGVCALLIFLGAGCTRVEEYPAASPQEEQAPPMQGGATPRALAPPYQ